MGGSSDRSDGRRLELHGEIPAEEHVEYIRFAIAGEGLAADAVELRHVFLRAKSQM